MEREMDRLFGATSAVIRAPVPDHCGEEGAEPEGKALDLPLHLRSNPHL